MKRLRLSLGVLGALAVPLVSHAQQALPVASTSGPSVNPQVAALDMQLLHAADAAHASEIAGRLEASRMARLSATTLLMLRRAQREAKDGRLHESLGDMNDAIDLQPDQAMLWRERAILRTLQDDPDGAVTDLGGALSRDQTDILSWSALSTIEERRSRPAQAYEAWEHVLKLDPMIGGGADRLGHLHKRMRGDPT